MVIGAVMNNSYDVCNSINDKYFEMKRVFNFFAKSETQQYWNPIVVLNFVNKFCACCCQDFANHYAWLLGGPQSDANLFPNVDSSWKVSVTFFCFTS